MTLKKDIFTQILRERVTADHIKGDTTGVLQLGEKMTPNGTTKIEEKLRRISERLKYVGNI